MKHTIKRICTLFLLLIIICPSLGFAKKIKFAHVYESAEPFHKWALWAAKEIKDRTNGKYNISVFPASSLGKEADINEGLVLGTVDIIYTGAGFLGRAYKPISIGQAPFIFRNYDHWEKYYASSLFKDVLAEGYKKSTGNSIIAVTYYGSRHVTSNKAINSPADMKGLKIRVPNVPMFMMFPKAVGANPTPIAFAEVYLALQSGTVEAQENPLPTIQAKKFHEVQKYINLTGHMMNEVYTVVRGGLWKKLSPSEKDIFQQAFERAAKGATNDIRYKEKSLISWFESQGNIVNASANTEAMRKATFKLHHKLLDKNSAPWSREIFNRISAIK